MCVGVDLLVLHRGGVDPHIAPLASPALRRGVASRLPEISKRNGKTWLPRTSDLRKGAQQQIHVVMQLFSRMSDPDMLYGQPCGVTTTENDPAVTKYCRVACGQLHALLHPNALQMRASPSSGASDNFVKRPNAAAAASSYDRRPTRQNRLCITRQNESNMSINVYGHRRRFVSAPDRAKRRMSSERLHETTETLWAESSRHGYVHSRREAANEMQGRGLEGCP